MSARRRRTPFLRDAVCLSLAGLILALYVLRRLVQASCFGSIYEAALSGRPECRDRFAVKVRQALQ